MGTKMFRRGEAFSCKAVEIPTETLMPFEIVGVINCRVLRVVHQVSFGGGLYQLMDGGQSNEDGLTPAWDVDNGEFVWLDLRAL